MATPAERYNPDGGLNIAFDYDVEPSVGDRVKIASGRKVAALTSVGDPLEIGEVLSVRNALKECVVRVKYNGNRQDRLSGDALPIGPFVWGPGSKAHPFDPETHHEINGIALTPATAADQLIEVLEW